MQLTSHLDRGVSLRELFPDATFCGSADILATGCSSDSRACHPGDVFVARLGSNADGHDFYRQAIAQGATAVIAERPLPTGDIPLCLVPDSRSAYGQLCHALAGNPSQHIKTIGVTGTFGKTTTACLIAAMLESSGNRVGLLSSLGYCDGREIEEAPCSTPTSPLLASWFARMASNGCSHAVVEVSAKSLARGVGSGLILDAACVTNVRHDLARDEKAWQRRRSLHGRILDQCAPHGFTIVNADDAGAAAYLDHVNGPVLTVGIHRPAEITATLIDRCRSEQTFLVHAGSETVPIRTAMIGDHQIYNYLVAAAVGLTYGIDLPSVVRGLEKVERLPARLERIECGQPFGVFVDCAKSAEGVAVALETLRTVTHGKLICVVEPQAQTRSGSLDRLVRAANSIADMVIVSNADSSRLRCHGRPSDCDPLANACNVPERSQAIQYALNRARPDDCVLIVGTETETHQFTRGPGLMCDDRETARQWLYARAHADAVASRQ